MGVEFPNQRLNLGPRCIRSSGPYPLDYQGSVHLFLTHGLTAIFLCEPVILRYALKALPHGQMEYFPVFYTFKNNQSGETTTCSPKAETNATMHEVRREASTPAYKIG